MDDKMDQSDEIPGTSTSQFEKDNAPQSKDPEKKKVHGENSDSDDEYETSDDSDEEIVMIKPGIEDYIEVPRSKGEPRPKTRDLIPIPVEKLAPFKALYEKQPENVKEMIRLQFYKNKPVVNPPPLTRFVSSVKSLKIQSKLKKQLELKEEKRKSQFLKLKSQRTEEINKKKSGEATVNFIDVKETDTQLIHVDYPARVVNVDRALSTMGGTGNITKVFNSGRKLPVRFRPEDPLCNAAMGQPQTTVGLLIKIRRRKPKPTPMISKEKKDIPMDLETPYAPSDNSVIINGVSISKNEILQEDKRLLKEASQDSTLLLKKFHNAGVPDQHYLKIPKDHKPKVNQKISLEAVGICNRSYTFNGLCDFQFLPLKRNKDGVVCSREKVFPLIGKPTANIDSLFVGDSLLKGTAEIDRTYLPPMMSRVDKPLDAIIEHLLDSDKIKMVPKMKAAHTGVIKSTRVRRNVYTLVYNFATDRFTSKYSIPTEPLKGALEDVAKRRMDGALVAQIAKCFEERPIWTKSELEFKTKMASFNLRYILPTVAYFANNGAWRSLWIKLGFDPRKETETFLYQTIDFRVPFIYKQFIDEGQKMDESIYLFRPERIPPKAQMFYQLFNLKCEEIDKLIENVKQKAMNNQLEYDIKFGWLKDGTFDYIRHVIIEKMENQLAEIGKISKPPLKNISLPIGEIEPSERLGVKTKQTNRLRNKKKRTTTDTKPKTGRKGKKGTKAGESTYQGFLKDLSIIDMNLPATEDKDEKNKILADVGDDSILVSCDEGESTSDDSEEEIEIEYDGEYDSDNLKLADDLADDEISNDEPQNKVQI